MGCIAVFPPIAVMLFIRSAVIAAAPAAEFPFTDNPITTANFLVGRLNCDQGDGAVSLLTVWPAKLSIDYSYSEIPLFRGTANDWVALIAVSTAFVGVGLLYRWNRPAFFFACFAAVAFLPTANLLFPIGTIMADRLLYLPSVGLIACLVLAFYASAERGPLKSVTPIVLCLIVTGFAARTFIRNSDWKDDFSLVAPLSAPVQRATKVHKVLASLLYTSDSSHSNLDVWTDEAEKTWRS